jgi:hypothetical protein
MDLTREMGSGDELAVNSAKLDENGMQEESIPEVRQFHVNEADSALTLHSSLD